MPGSRSFRPSRRPFPSRPIFVLRSSPTPSAARTRTARLERLIKLQELLLEQNPSPQIYREIADTLGSMDQ